MDYALAITYLVNTNHFNGVVLRHNGAIASTYAGLYIENDDTNQDVKPSEQVLISAYNAQVALEAIAQADADSRAITKTDVKKYLLEQLTSVNPNVVTIYNNLKPIVDSNTRILNAVTNTINLYSLADGQAVDLATNKGKAQYLRAVLHVLSLLG